MHQAIDDVLIVSLMAEAVDIGRINREFFDYLFVSGKLVDEAPVSDLVHSEAGDFDCSPFAQDRDRALEIGWTRGCGRLDNAQCAVAELQGRNRSILSLNFRKRCGSARMNADNIAKEPLQHVD